MLGRPLDLGITSRFRLREAHRQERARSRFMVAQEPLEAVAPGPVVAVASGGAMTDGDAATQ